MGPVRPDRIPLFPLNVVLLPGADLPLHIFEPRYRDMVYRCLRQKSEFGMLLALPNGVVRVGCTAEILEVTKKHDDGRMDILAVGRAPFRVVEFFSDHPLLEGLVEYVEDRESPVKDGLHPELLELYETCHTLVFGDYPKNLEGELPEGFSFLVAAKLPMDPMWKQQILELRSENDRRERLASYLRGWAPHLQKEDVLRHQASGNGNALN